MEIKRSNLKMDNFAMLSSNISTVAVDKKVTQEKLKSIPIDLDFDILSNKNNSSKIRIMLEVRSNEIEGPLPGYVYSVICSSDFNIKGLGKLKQKDKDKHVLFTALPLTIAMVRSHLYNITSNFPHGHYVLPSIDLMDLFSKKYDEK
jgi:hypothetical protein